MRRFRFSLEAMWPEVSTLNLVKVVPALQMPVFFFVGSQRSLGRDLETHDVGTRFLGEK